MSSLKRVSLTIETEKGLEGLCGAIYKKLNDKDIDFGDNYQITISKKDVFTDITIDYIEQSKESNHKGLTSQKKEILHDLLGSVSNQDLDFNKIRDEYKKES